MLVIIASLIAITVLAKLTFSGFTSPALMLLTHAREEWQPVPSDKSSVISRAPYRARVMVIIRATVSKVTQNNLERTMAAWLIGVGRSRDECGHSSGPQLLLSPARLINF